MSGYFTDLLLNDSAESSANFDDESSFVNSDTQHTSDTALYIPTKRSAVSISYEQRIHTTNVVPAVSTATSSSILTPMDYFHLDSSSYHEQQEQLSSQALDGNPQDSQQASTHTRSSIMTLIENTFLEIIASLSILKPVELSFMARTLQRSSTTTTGFSATSDLSDPFDVSSVQDLSEPRKKILSLNHSTVATTLTRYVRVLEVIYDALANNIVMTKRDIFYRDLPLFRSQRTVDKIVDDISCHYNLSRSSLNVSAFGKGRIYGSATIILKNHRTLDCLSTRDDNAFECNDDYGVLIPPINQILDVECRARVIMVIEKEASFRHLVSAGFVQMLFQQCILITGCGYPDFATRHLIKHISLRYPAMPIVAVMDNDPYGLDIYSVYKWGSLAQAHDSVNLTIPSMAFLGLGSDDRKEYRIPDTAYTPLTTKDREKGIRMILTAQQMQYSKNNNMECKSFILELCKVLHMNQKCELQALVTDAPLGFIDYLRMKIEQYMVTIYSY